MTLSLSEKGVRNLSASQLIGSNLRGQLFGVDSLFLFNAYGVDTFAYLDAIILSYYIFVLRVVDILAYTEVKSRVFWHFYNICIAYSGHYGFSYDFIYLCMSS